MASGVDRANRRSEGSECVAAKLHGQNMSVPLGSRCVRQPYLLRLRALIADRVLTAPDTWERHLIVAQLVGSPASLIDVGGLRRQLRSFLPHTDVTAVNVSEPADLVIPAGDLPFDDGAFDAAACLDVLEHVTHSERRAFVTELVRVARHRAVLCCPLGSPEHVAAEHEIQAWYESVTGEEHPWLAEHLTNGLPTLDEIREILGPYRNQVRFLFHGDFREVNDQFKRIVLARYRHRLADVLGYARFRLSYRPRVTVTDDPSPWSNRVFVVVDRG